MSATMIWNGQEIGVGKTPIFFLFFLKKGIDKCGKVCYNKGTKKEEVKLMLTMKMTYHARVERIDRIVACIQHLGVNEIVLEVRDNLKPDHIYSITDTGIILVRSYYDGTLITAYMATLPKIIALCQGNVPPALKKRVINNNKRYKFLLEM